LNHAVSAVFLSKIIKDVADKTKQLHKDKLDQEHLLDFANKISLHFGPANVFIAEHTPQMLLLLLAF
jgi:hypothetical protein